MSKDREKKADVKDEARKTLGERLREAREYLGFSQEEVATYLQVSRSALSNIESGQRKVDALELKKLASLYPAFARPALPVRLRVASTPRPVRTA